MGKRILNQKLASLVFLVAVSQVCWSAEIVSPVGVENRDGDILFLPVDSPYPTPGPMGTPDGWRAQEIHPPDAFAPLGSGPFTIHEIAWRPDISVNEPIAPMWDLTVKLSTTSATFDSMSSVFADNYGPGGVASLFEGALPLATDGVPKEGGLVHDFDYVVPLDTPFVYDPAEGNLLVEWTSQTDLAESWVWVDAESSPSGFIFEPAAAVEEARFRGPGLFVTKFTTAESPLPPQVTMVSPSEEKGADSIGRPSSGGGDFRGQQMYDGADFWELPNSRQTLTSIAFRPDVSNRFTGRITVPLRITLSVSDDDHLDREYAMNLDPDSTVVVFDGEIIWQANADNDPNEFDFVIPFDNPFEFDPSKGNLVFDMLVPEEANEVGNWFIDAARPHPNGPMKATGGSPSSSSGEYFDFSWPAEFTFIAKPWLGDANLDGEFNTADLIKVFQAGEYEDAIAMNSTWSEGDWNGDADFDTGDLVAAFQDGGFEQGPKAALVPEPSTVLLVIAALIGLVAQRRDRPTSHCRLATT